jgi:hypothetical protein
MELVPDLNIQQHEIDHSNTTARVASPEAIPEVVF